MVVFARGVFLNFALDSDELRDCYSPGDSAEINSADSQRVISLCVCLAPQLVISQKSW